MRINAINGLNYSTGLQRKVTSPTLKSIPDNERDTVSFKGGKGATIGAAVGGALLGIAALTLAPYFAIGLLEVGMFTGAGAIAGHNIEKDYKHDKEQAKKK